MASSLQQAIEIAREKAYVILDGSLLRKDQVAMSSDRDRPFYPGKHETGRCSTPCRGLDAVVKRADSGHFTGELARAALFAEESEHTASEPRRTHPELLRFQPNTHSVECDAGAFHRMVTNLDVATGERAVAVEHWYRHRTSIENVFRDAKLRAALRHLPSGYPQVNTAWTWGVLLAASIAGWLHQLTATRSGRPAFRPRHPSHDRHPAAPADPGTGPAGSSRRRAHPAPTTRAQDDGSQAAAARGKGCVVRYCPEAQRWDRPGSPGASFRQVPCSGSYSSRSKTYMSSPSRMSEYGLGPEPRTWP